MTKIKEVQHNLKNTPLLKNYCNCFTIQAEKTTTHGHTDKLEATFPGKKNASSSAFWHREKQVPTQANREKKLGQQNCSAGEGDCVMYLFTRSPPSPCAAPNQLDSSPLFPPWAPRALFHLPASPGVFCCHRCRPFNPVRSHEPALGAARTYTVPLERDARTGGDGEFAKQLLRGELLGQ